MLPGGVRCTQRRYQQACRAQTLSGRVELHHVHHVVKVEEGPLVGLVHKLKCGAHKVALDVCAVVLHLHEGRAGGRSVRHLGARRHHAEEVAHVHDPVHARLGHERHVVKLAVVSDRVGAWKARVIGLISKENVVGVGGVAPIVLGEHVGHVPDQLECACVRVVVFARVARRCGRRRLIVELVHRVVVSLANLAADALLDQHGQLRGGGGRAVAVVRFRVARWRVLRPEPVGRRLGGVGLEVEVAEGDGLGALVDV